MSDLLSIPSNYRERTKDPTLRRAAKKLTKELDETFGANGQILLLVAALGEAFVREVKVDADAQFEAKGPAAYRLDGEMRTRGGTFFYMVRKAAKLRVDPASPVKMWKIFAPRPYAATLALRNAVPVADGDDGAPATLPADVLTATTAAGS